LTATGQDKVKDGFLPLPEGFYNEAIYNDIESVRAAVNDRTCAVMLELVQAEGGVIPADPAFVKQLRELCDEHGLLLIFDEVQTGMGRTGTLFAYEQYGVEPDIFTVAKGLGNGFPIGAMLGKAKLRDAFGPGSHASTFGGTPIAATVAKTVLTYMVEHRVPERAAKMGEFLVNSLRERLKDHPYVEQVRGKGLLIGIVCKGPAAELISEAHKRRLLVVPAGPNVVRLLPNLLLTQEDAERGLDILTEVFASQLTKEGTA
jgi:acetylornithine aminotransferase